jgi:hypothetical protein
VRSSQFRVAVSVFSSLQASSNGQSPKAAALDAALQLALQLQLKLKLQL